MTNLTIDNDVPIPGTAGTKFTDAADKMEIGGSVSLIEGEVWPMIEALRGRGYGCKCGSDETGQWRVWRTEND